MLLNKLLFASIEMDEQNGCLIIQLFVLKGIFINWEGNVSEKNSEILNYARKMACMMQYTQSI